ncbi:DUF302 domain-containing protein [Desulfoluna spongiiphila]|uniref:DUF302 domain-containing protein n=1 Tax=Desulfoluna spongiiphila TaxID=419481 RepID=UPI0012522BF3|nr:DUF302 domain-containing protein [Desulfoluna spongiiphila]VVS95703.1 prokaryotic membrane lipoprotein lipid attachment site profile [Desulfoluna spongiiphila]
MRTPALSAWVVVGLFGVASVFLSGCKSGGEPQDRFSAVDKLSLAIDAEIPEKEIVLVIDHSRLAEEKGVEMPASQVTIYTDPGVNTPLLKHNPLVGLDLPFRILVYSEDMQGETAKTVYASADFIRKRHGLDASVSLDAYTEALTNPLAHVPPELVSEVDGEGVTPGYGIQFLSSPFGFEATIERLQKNVMAEGDTKWFTVVDYKEDAKSLGDELPRMKLLLFGGPAPGGMAMAKFPKLGLDAFCQKVLVYENGKEEVQVAYNDIVLFAELHYGNSIKPHHMLNGRLSETFKRALELNE